MVRARQGDWCILRTGGGSTIMLAKSLAEAGFDAWTPIEVRERLAGRERKPVDQSIAVTPSFVFARCNHLFELVELSRSPSLLYRVWDSELRKFVTKGHPHFSVFRFQGEYPLIKDADLVPLRKIERKAALKRSPVAYQAGAEVLLPERGFEGLTGTVGETKGQYTMVTFPGFPFAIKIGTLHLQSVDIEHDSSAARAA